MLSGPVPEMMRPRHRLPYRGSSSFKWEALEVKHAFAPFAPVMIEHPYDFWTRGRCYDGQQLASQHDMAPALARILERNPLFVRDCFVPAVATPFRRVNGHAFLSRPAPGIIARTPNIIMIKATLPIRLVNSFDSSLIGDPQKVHSHPSGHVTRAPWHPAGCLIPEDVIDHRAPARTGASVDLRICVPWSSR